MSTDEEVAYATIVAVAQAKTGQYSPLVNNDGGELGGEERPKNEAEESGQSIGTDAKTLAEMLVMEEKKVLGDLRMQLMSEVRP